MIFQSTQEVHRIFGYDFIYLDLALMAIWIFVLLGVRKNRHAFYVGLFGFGVYFMADYVIWYSIMHVRHIIGIDPLVFLLYFSVTYSMLQFSYAFLMFSEKTLKWRVFWTVFLFSGWLVIGFASQLLPIDDRVIDIYRAMGSQRIGQILAVVGEYLLLLFLAWMGKCNLTYKKVGLIFLLGVYIHFTMEATLMIPGIRPQDLQVFYFNSLFEFNTGAPVLYLLWWLTKDKFSEAKAWIATRKAASKGNLGTITVVPVKNAAQTDTQVVLTLPRALLTYFVFGIIATIGMAMVAGLFSGSLPVSAGSILNISIKLSVMIAGCSLILLYLKRLLQKVTKLKVYFLVLLIALTLLPFFWTLDDFFFNTAFGGLHLGFSSAIGMVNIIFACLVLIGYEVFIVSRGLESAKWRAFRTIYFVAIMIVGIFVWFRFLRVNERPDAIGWVIIASYMALLLVAIGLVGGNAYRLSMRMDAGKVRDAVRYIGHVVVMMAVLVVMETIDWVAYEFTDFSWASSTFFALILVWQ